MGWYGLRVYKTNCFPVNPLNFVNIKFRVRVPCCTGVFYFRPYRSIITETFCIWMTVMQFLS